jgi:DNA-binding MarR family transcriptional regulator
MTSPTQPRRTIRDEARSLVDACPGWNSRLAARRISAALDRDMAKLGLSAAQVGLLAQIAVIADDTLGALAQRAGLEQSTLSRNLRTLEREGLIEIAIVESDLRRRAVWLTEAGIRRLEAALPVWRAAQTRLAQVLSPDLARGLAEQAEALGET